MIPSAGVVRAIPQLALPRRHVLLLGGSFDPVHQGHIRMARAAKEQTGADEVWLLPAGDAPLKDRTLSPAKHRVRMLELAVKDEPDMHVVTIELDRPGKSYTVDTLRQLCKDHPDTAFTLLVGADQLAQFDKWKEPEKVLRMAHLAVVSRNGQSLRSGWKHRNVYMDPVPVSSTEVRQGKKLEFVDPEVLDYIYASGLYVKDFVKALLPQRRWLHSLSVAFLAREFARANGHDAHKAWLAGLFHDICKAMPLPVTRELVIQADPQELESPVPVWHGFAGAEYVRQTLHLEDPEIYDAIYHHVRGTSTRPAAMAVYCADKLDLLRQYDSYDLIDACLADLENGFALVKRENEMYLKEQGHG